MKNELKNNLINILENIEHYKKSKQFVKFIEDVCKNLLEQDKIYDLLLNKILNEIMKESNLNLKINQLEDHIENKTIKLNEDLNNLRKTIKKTSFFIEKNTKKHINKIVTDTDIIYEYKDYYIWYINDYKLNILEEYRNKFMQNKIISIKIDGQKRTKIEKITKEDIKYAKVVEIKIEK